MITGTYDVLARHKAQAYIGLSSGAYAVVTKRNEDLEVALRSASKTSRLSASILANQATKRNFLGVSICLLG